MKKPNTYYRQFSVHISKTRNEYLNFTYCKGYVIFKQCSLFGCILPVSEEDITRCVAMWDSDTPKTHRDVLILSFVWFCSPHICFPCHHWSRTVFCYHLEGIWNIKIKKQQQRIYELKNTKHLGRTTRKRRRLELHVFYENP